MNDTITVPPCSRAWLKVCSPERSILRLLLLHDNLALIQYNDGIPDDSRYAVLKDTAEGWIAHLQSEEGQKEVSKVRELTTLAETGASFLPRVLGQARRLMVVLELNCTVTHLALAWIIKQNPNTSTVILGASKPEQVLDNLKAIDVLDKLTPEILKKVDAILGNKPDAIVRFLHLLCD